MKLIGSTLLIWVTNLICLYVPTALVIKYLPLENPITFVSGDMIQTITLLFLYSFVFVVLFSRSHKDQVHRPVRQGFVFGLLIGILVSVIPQTLLYLQTTTPIAEALLNIGTFLLASILTGIMAALGHRSPHST